MRLTDPFSPGRRTRGQAPCHRLSPPRCASRLGNGATSRLMGLPLGRVHPPAAPRNACIRKSATQHSGSAASTCSSPPTDSAPPSDLPPVGRSLTSATLRRVAEAVPTVAEDTAARALRIVASRDSSSPSGCHWSFALDGSGPHRLSSGTRATVGRNVRARDAGQCRCAWVRQPPRIRSTQAPERAAGPPARSPLAGVPSKASENLQRRRRRNLNLDSLSLATTALARPRT